MQAALVHLGVLAAASTAAALAQDAPNDASTTHTLDQLQRYVGRFVPEDEDFCVDSYGCLQFRGGGPIQYSGLFMRRDGAEFAERLVGGEIQLLALRALNSGERVLLIESRGYGPPDSPKGVEYTRIHALVIAQANVPRVSDLVKVEWDMESGDCGDSPNSISEFGKILSSELTDTDADEIPEIRISVEQTDCATNSTTLRNLQFRYDGVSYTQ
jgi:hypothetical protein